MSCSTQTNYDIEDIYYRPFDTVKKLKFYEPEKDPRILTEMSDKQAYLLARHKETIARLCWMPYFHNPSLKHRLNRITAKTLMIWGENDPWEPLEEAQKWSANLNCIKSLEIVKGAGHCPHDEAPEEVNPLLISVIQQAT